jgi:hypothetical protein
MKNYLIILAAVAQTACTTPVRMSANDLSNYKINCDQRNEQYQFLESQRYSDNQRFILAGQMTSILGIVSNVWNGTAADSSAGMDGEHEAMIKAQQRQLRQRCLLEDSFKKPQQ